MLSASQKYWRRIAAVLPLIAGLLIPTASPLAQPEGNPQVIPPNAKPYGLTYGQWSARHWQWTYSMPADHHPLTDTADCSDGQSGPVWFLGGTFAPTPTGPDSLLGIANRTCTVPAGKALFFPILDAEASVAEGNGTTEQELRDFAKFLVDHATDLQAAVDGVAIQNLQAYRKQSPLFQFGPLPENNLLGLQSGTISPSVADGYYLMLAPRSVGLHMIHFSGAIIFTQAQDGFDFSLTLNITYQLHIV